MAPAGREQETRCDLEPAIRLQRPDNKRGLGPRRVIDVEDADAVVADLYMSSEDLAEEASVLLGREISADEARTWKSRGLKRLRELLGSEKESA